MEKKIKILKSQRTVSVGFGSVRVLCKFVTGGFWFCSVLTKMRVLVRFVRFGFGSNPISSLSALTNNNWCGCAVSKNI